MEWKDIPGYEGKYKISENGDIMSLSRELKTPTGTTHYVTKDRILKTRIASNKYTMISFSDTMKKSKSFTVHRLVMYAFKGISDLHINHIDHNRQNNNIRNLEYVTQAQNNRDIPHKLAITDPKIQSNIRAMWSIGVKIKDICDIYKISRDSFFRYNRKELNLILNK